ncbi:hypothetical protein [Brevundimonas sp.]|uniref:hypothetical protein n=1 Tax=Brevundimonas sp. TaxID=1871086 RepID=UPI001E10F1B4|nr:hypothetical protein [Brevundimonas sp.]MBA4001672.1 hypothetical protein [Brevundimonas sp.]
MALFLITYDLRKPGRNYESLYELLRDTWEAKPIAESVWLAELKGPAPTIRDFIFGEVDANDRVVVIEITDGADWATGHGMPDGVALLRQYSP